MMFSFCSDQRENKNGNCGRASIFTSLSFTLGYLSLHNSPDWLHIKLAVYSFIMVRSVEEVLIFRSATDRAFTCLHERHLRDFPQVQ